MRVALAVEAGAAADVATAPVFRRLVVGRLAGRVDDVGGDGRGGEGESDNEDGECEAHGMLPCLSLGGFLDSTTRI